MLLSQPQFNHNITSPSTTVGLDTTSTTRPGLKQNLSKLYNDTLDSLALNSDFKDKLIIGDHHLDCSGGVLLARYKDSRSGKFDNRRRIRFDEIFSKCAKGKR